MRKQADALKVCPIPDACLLVMAQRPSRLLGLPETRSLIFLIKNSPDQVELPGLPTTSRVKTCDKKEKHKTNVHMAQQTNGAASMAKCHVPSMRN
jgi:hypothetical protein